MANINLYDTYNKKRRKFGVNDSTRFQESFVEAVNLTYGEMNNLVFQANTLAPINSFDDVIDKRSMTLRDYLTRMASLIQSLTVRMSLSPSQAEFLPLPILVWLLEL